MTISLKGTCIMYVFGQNRILTPLVVNNEFSRRRIKWFDACNTRRWEWGSSSVSYLLLLFLQLLLLYNNAMSWNRMTHSTFSYLRILFFFVSYGENADPEGTKNIVPTGSGIVILDARSRNSVNNLLLLYSL